MFSENSCPVDFTDLAVQADPFAAYDFLRDKDPVYFDPNTGHYNVLDFDLLRKIATDTKRFSNDSGLVQVRSGPLGEQIQQIQREHGVPLSRVLLITDPPEHGFFRSFVDKAFSPARVKQLETYLTDVVRQRIDTFADLNAIEFVQDMAVMVPLLVVANLLGVDNSKLADIKRWSDASSGGTDPTLSDQDKLTSVRTACELQQFLLNQAKAYREQPNDTLISLLANTEIGGRRLTDSELVSMAQQIITAGHETTTSVMASAMLRMIQNDGLEDELRQNPNRIPAFLEEVLRLDAPLQSMFRKTTEPVELAGIAVPKDAIIIMRWGAANRDPNRFACPAAVDMDRTNGRQHLAFGFGVHFCIGNQLARAELRIAFEQILRRLKNFRLAQRPDYIKRKPHYFIYAITELHIEFEKNE